MKEFPIGTVLNVDGDSYLVIGYIVYALKNNPQQQWTEYRLLSKSNNEYWLSIDEQFEEYSISEPTEIAQNQIPHKWHKIDSGTQVVVRSAGDVDVDEGEEAEFIEHEDDTEEEILSVEIWEDGAEISEGYYLDEDEICKTGFKDIGSQQLSSFNENNARNFFQNAFVILFIFLGIFSTILDSDIPFIVTSSFVSQEPAYDHFQNNADYKYLTSISGVNNDKAHVYQALVTKESPKLNKIKYIEKSLIEAKQLSVDQTKVKQEPVMDYLVKDLIINLNTSGDSTAKPEVVTEHQDENGVTVGLLTDKEYCLFYHPEDNKEQIYVQVSKRKYNYSSDSRPYHASPSIHRWYRSHYYNAGYSNDLQRWKSTPSSYKMYDGPIVKDLGNGYYDVYSNDIRRSSIMNRKSSGGGLSNGK